MQRTGQLNVFVLGNSWEEWSEKFSTESTTSETWFYIVQDIADEDAVGGVLEELPAINKTCLEQRNKKSIET